MDVKQLILDEFGSLTPIQEKAYSKIVEGRDVLITAPTGTGKTEAALLPLLDRLVNNPDNKRGVQPISIVYITPLKSLNRDMVARIKKWADKLGLRVALRHGDTSQRDRSFQSRHPPHILITTPETLQILIASKNFREHFRHLQAVVIDEIHELINSKRGAQLSLGLTRLETITQFQRVGVSATLNSLPTLFYNNSFELISDDYSKPPSIEVIQVKGENESLQLRKIVSILRDYINNHSKTLTFTNTRYMAELIGSHLIMDGLDVGVHHGSLSKEERESLENKFKTNSIGHLVCTSSLELGIDIGDVDLVLHIGSPRQVRKALQRIGRSGHGIGRQSKGVFLTLNEFDYNEGLTISEWSAKGRLEKDEYIYPALDVLTHAIAGEVMVSLISEDDLYSLISSNPLYGSFPRETFDQLLEYMHRNRIIFRREDGSLGTTKRTREYYFTRVSTIPSANRFKLVHNNRIIGLLDERFVYTLNEGDVFITKGVPWIVLSIEEDQVLVERAKTYTLAIPDWEGEQIPVSFELSKDVGERMGYDKPVIEVYGDLMVVYSFLGSRGNYALALALANVLSRYFNREVSVKTSPYAVFLQLPLLIGKDSLVSLISGVNVRNEILSRINRIELFGYIFSHVMFYMGASDKYHHYSPMFLSRLEDSPYYEEALNYFWFKYCDADSAQRFIPQFSKLEFKIHKRLPPRLKELLAYLSGSQVILPDFPEGAVDSVLSSVPNVVSFKCVHCGKEFKGSFNKLPKKCPFCGSVLLAPLDNRPREYSKDELMKRVSLYNSYGRRSIIALSVYGVGTDNAMRILSRLHRDERSLVIDLLKAREQFLRTKKYWKPRS